MAKTALCFGGPLHGHFKTTEGPYIEAAVLPEHVPLKRDDPWHFNDRVDRITYQFQYWYGERPELSFEEIARWYGRQRGAFFLIAVAEDYVLTEQDQEVIRWYLRAAEGGSYGNAEKQPPAEQLIAADLLEDHGFTEQAKLLRTPIKFFYPVKTEEGVK